MDLFNRDNYNCLVDAGIWSCKLDDKDSVIDELCLHHTIVRNVCELEQLRMGLKTLGVIDAIEIYPSLMETYFLKSMKSTTPGINYLIWKYVLHVQFETKV